MRKPICCFSVTKLCSTLCNPMDCSMPGSSVLHCLLEYAQIHVHWVGNANHLIHCHPLFFLPSLFPRIRFFSNDLPLCIRWAKYWSFSFSISPSNNYPGLISISIDLFDLRAVQGTVKSLLQHHNSNASILWHSAFFMVQFSHLCMTTGKKFWLYGPLSAKWCLCFVKCCLGLS